MAVLTSLKGEWDVGLQKNTIKFRLQTCTQGEAEFNEDEGT